MFFVQVRRGGFPNPSPWGEKGNSFATLEKAEEHVYGIADQADKYNCVIDWIISDENGNIVEKG